MIAELRNISTGRVSRVRAEHLIGRSPRCDLRIHAEHISAQHAVIRWAGECWEIRDLGSRNGTWVDDALLGPSESKALRCGSRICFGEQGELWLLEDDSPPQVMAISLETEAVVLPAGDILALPSNENPALVVFRRVQGEWEREDPDGRLVRLEDQDRLLVAPNEHWLFCCPHVVPRTTSVEDRLSVHSVALDLAVSLDEEHVEVMVRTPRRNTSLGSRAHHYLLLTLARHRIQDQAAGHAASACGWIYVEDLLRDLRVTPEQLNLEVFRVREQFGALGLSDPAGVIERRPRTRQLRVGIADLRVRSSG